MSITTSGSVLFLFVEFLKVVFKLLLVIALELTLKTKDVSFFVEQDIEVNEH